MQNAKEKAWLAPNEPLRQERQRRGWSRAYIAEQIGVADPKTIGRWERGRAFPSAYFLQRLCTLFQMQADELGLWQKEESQKMAFSPQHQAQSASRTPILDPALPLAQPDGLVGRERLLHLLKSRLCSGKSLAHTALSGLPGAGKTALALELAQSDELRHYFSDGILWVSLGPEPQISEELKRWSKLLGIEEREFSQKGCREDQTLAIHERIGTRKMLLIIDDAWTFQDALAFKLGGLSCSYLLTTRIPSVALYFANTGACKVETLAESASLELLARFAPTIVAQEPSATRELINLVGGLPLALQLMGKYLQAQVFSGQPRRWHMALARLKLAEARLKLGMPHAPFERQMGLPAEAPVSLQNAINLSYQRLAPDAQQALLVCATLLSTPGNFFEDAALALDGISLETLDNLLDAGLLASTGLGRYTLHETIVDFARLKSEQPETETMQQQEKTVQQNNVLPLLRENRAQQNADLQNRASAEPLPVFLFEPGGGDRVTLR